MSVSMKLLCVLCSMVATVISDPEAEPQFVYFGRQYHAAPFDYGPSLDAFQSRSRSLPFPYRRTSPYAAPARGYKSPLKYFPAVPSKKTFNTRPSPFASTSKYTSKIAYAAKPAPATKTKKIVNVNKAIDFGRSFGLNSLNSNSISGSSSGASDFIGQTKSFAETVVPTLKKLAANPTSAAIANAVIRENEDTICVADLEEGIEAIEAATEQLVALEDNINTLISSVDKFRLDSTDPVAILRETGDLLRILDPIVSSFPASTGTARSCSPANFGQNFNLGGFDSSANSGSSFGSLASLEETLADNEFVTLTPAGRQQLQQASKFISSVSGLQSSLGPVVSEFRNLCNPDRSFNTAAISALGELMSSLASQFGDKTGAGARGQEFISNIVPQLAKISDLGLDVECKQPEDLKAAATSLDEVADLVEAIGVEALSEDLGIDLTFGGGLANNGADLSEGTGLGLLAQKNSFRGAGAFNFGNNFRFRG